MNSTQAIIFFLITVLQPGLIILSPLEIGKRGKMLYWKNFWRFSWLTHIESELVNDGRLDDRTLGRRATIPMV